MSTYPGMGNFRIFLTQFKTRDRCTYMSIWTMFVIFVNYNKLLASLWIVSKKKKKRILPTPILQQYICCTNVKHRARQRRRGVTTDSAEAVSHRVVRVTLSKRTSSLSEIHTHYDDNYYGDIILSFAIRDT